MADPYFYVNISLMGFHIIIEFLIMASLMRIARQRQTVIALYLGLTGFFLLLSAIFALTFYVMGILFSTELTIIGLTLTVNCAAVVFLIRFIRGLYEKPEKRTIKIITIFYCVFIAIILSLLLIDLVIPDPETFEIMVFPIFGLYALAGLGGNLVAYIYLIVHTIKIFKKVEKGTMEYRGMQYILIYGLFAVLSFSMMLISFGTQNTGLLYSLTWILSTISSLFAYYGFIYPRKLREKMEGSSIQENSKLTKLRIAIGCVFVASTLIILFLLNLKFVQLGIPDWIMNDLFSALPLTEQATITTGIMLTLGFTGLFGCLITGFLIHRFKISFHLRVLITASLEGLLLLLVVLTDIVESATIYGWIIIFAFVFGSLTCVVYIFLFDLIEKRYRGLLAGVMTAIIYFIGASSTQVWSFEGFRSAILPALVVLLVITLVCILFDVFEHNDIEKNQSAGKHYELSLGKVVVFFFLILFIDSFGFLRITSDITIMSETWQSPDPLFRVYLGICHAVAAVLIGVLYKKLKPLLTGMISLILFVIADILIAIAYNNFDNIQFLFPALYTSAVSIYNLIFLSLLADISDKNTIGKNVGIGMGVFGWFSSYLATGLSVFLGSQSWFPFQTHLITAAILAGISLGIVYYFKRIKAKNKAN